MVALTGGVRVERYWSPAVAENSTISDGEAIEETRRLLDESVQIHLLSEVPLGAFLSGGIDSSGVVATMARMSGQPVRTFSIGFEEREFDESQYAAEVSRALGTQHTQLVVRPDAELLFDQVARALDEPFADPSALPTFLVSHLARRDVTVALSGDGGDELFGGYTRYFEINGANTLPAIARTMLRTVGLSLPHAAYGRNRLLSLARSMRGRYAGTVALPVREAEGGLLREELAAACAAIRKHARSLVRRLVVARLHDAAHDGRRAELSARRYPHEGRSHEHGALARGARAVARSRGRRVRALVTAVD